MRLARAATVAGAIAVLLPACASTPRRDVPASATPSAPALSLAAPVNHPDPEARRYLEDVRRAIGRGWTYPCTAGSSAAGCVYAEGKVVVEFSVASNGALISADVTTSSGHPELDAAATDAVKGAAPFPPVPAALKRPGPGLQIRASMIYRSRTAP